MIELSLSPFVDDLRFGEAPRWHEGRLWFSDQTVSRIASTASMGI